MSNNEKPIVMVDEIQQWGGKPPFHRGSCHLTVDGETPEHIAALHEFAAIIGLKRAWFQPRSTPHYDLTPSKRRAAIRAGARPVPAFDQARARIKRRQN